MAVWEGEERRGEERRGGSGVEAFGKMSSNV